jgi:hypothetical protein
MCLAAGFFLILEQTISNKHLCLGKVGFKRTGVYMKSNLLIALAISLGCGIFGNSAQASVVSFNMFDHNHDGRWDRREFYEARRYYHHHGRPYCDFGRCDLDHDGYLSPREVRAIRYW